MQVTRAHLRSEHQAQHLPCNLKRSTRRHTVSEVVDAETLRLDDARVIRLIGALPPLAPQATGTPGWPPGEHAKQALSELVLGHSVRLYYPESGKDRYGRTLAHVVLEDHTGQDTSSGDTNGTWVQEWLIGNGHARAYVLPGIAECAEVLIAREAVARQARRGLWALAAYQPHPAWATRRLKRLAGTFQLVEGRVRTIGASRGNIYLNFGRWFGFSVFIAADALRHQPDWADRLKALDGRRVRVRGWIELRNGSYIEVTDASQLEVLDGEP